jgi:hypothetical protein
MVEERERERWLMVDREMVEGREMVVRERWLKGERWLQVEDPQAPNRVKVEGAYMEVRPQPARVACWWQSSLGL